jgi:uncharacterized protein
MRVIASVHEVPVATWNALANPSSGPSNPLVSHAFFSALEDSGSAVAQTGWAGSHIVLEEAGKTVGIAPCYVKNHSQGEYVFDHAFADAYHRAGGRYYPKLQCSVPFSPVTGPRLFAATPALRLKLLDELQTLTAKTKLSSAHITFIPELDWAAAPESWLKRQDIQFHWHNHGYGSYSDFLATLSSSKRKNLRKEREAVLARGITFELLTGDDLKPHHWDHFFAFYMDTGSRKWGRPYLTREFFARVHETMRPQTLLVMAKREGKTIAGALNFIGSDIRFCILRPVTIAPSISRLNTDYLSLKQVLKVNTSWHEVTCQ